MGGAERYPRQDRPADGDAPAHPCGAAICQVPKGNPPGWTLAGVVAGHVAGAGQQGGGAAQQIGLVAVGMQHGRPAAVQPANQVARQGFPRHAILVQPLPQRMRPVVGQEQHARPPPRRRQAGREFRHVALDASHTAAVQQQPKFTRIHDIRILHCSLQPDGRPRLAPGRVLQGKCRQFGMPPVARSLRLIPQQQFEQRVTP